MGSKVMVLLSISMIIALLISPEVAARNLAQTSTNFKPEVAAKETKGTDDAKFPGYFSGGSGYEYGGTGNGGYQYERGYQYGEPGIGGGYQSGALGNGFQFGGPGN